MILLCSKNGLNRDPPFMHQMKNKWTAMDDDDDDDGDDNTVQRKYLSVIHFISMNIENCRWWLLLN